MYDFVIANKNTTCHRKLGQVLEYVLTYVGKGQKTHKLRSAHENFMEMILVKMRLSFPVVLEVYIYTLHDKKLLTTLLVLDKREEEEIRRKQPSRKVTAF